MKEFKAFVEELNDSPWMGSISEAGFGIPIAANYLDIPGASKTILKTVCNYAKLFQHDHKRSVSHEAVSKTCRRSLIRDSRMMRYDAGTRQKTFEKLHPLFTLMVSGAHAAPDSGKVSHGWVCIDTCISSEVLGVNDTFRSFAFHFHFDMTPDREYAGKEILRHVTWFAEKVLLNKYDSWGEAIKNMPNSNNLFNIDVIRADDISVEEHLLLVSKRNPLAYFGGEFKRPRDFFRRFDLIYRGSFNPITIAHEKNSDDALLEIGISNARKIDSSLDSVASRLREIDACELPTIVTTGLPAFAHFDQMMVSKFNKKFSYLVGVDTFNAIVADKFCPTDDFLSGFYGRDAFEVIPRDNLSITKNHRTEKIGYSIRESRGYDDGISSTKVREGNFSLVPDTARKLIERRFSK